MSEDVVAAWEGGGIDVLETGYIGMEAGKRSHPVGLIWLIGQAAQFVLDQAFFCVLDFGEEVRGWFPEVTIDDTGCCTVA